MKHTGPPQWTRLDNAAIIFPSNSSARDSKVFRFFCELKEPVDARVLQSALDKTVPQFPFFRSVMHRGLFWYYLEDSDLPATVLPEEMPPCSLMYHPESKSLLFRVSCHGCRINLEIYHALTDGTGAMQFLSALICNYLTEKHRPDFSGSLPHGSATRSQMGDDSFQKYYEKPARTLPAWEKRAYRLRGERLPEYRLAVIEGRMSVKALLDCCHARGVTLTALLTAVLIRSIHEGMPLRERRRPVVITIPVNLRNYFPSETTRNFFTVINVPYDFSRQEDSLDAVAASVKQTFQEELKEEKLHERLNLLCSLEHSIPLRLLPLMLKDPVLRAAGGMARRKVSASFSNVGKVVMPEGLREYIRLFGAFTSPNQLQATSCSFLDTYVITFAGHLRSHDTECAFFRALVRMGIDVTVASNLSFME